MRIVGVGAAPNPGVHVGSIPWVLITVVLVLFVVYRAWRGARRQVASAVAEACAEASARVEAELRASAAAQANVAVHVGDNRPGESLSADEAALLAAYRAGLLDQGGAALLREHPEIVRRVEP